MIKIIELDYINAAFSHVGQTTNRDVISVDLGAEHLRWTGRVYSKWDRSPYSSRVSEGPRGNDLAMHMQQVFVYIC